MDLGIQGKRVLVTAASKGIGKAVAEEFIKEGCSVAICSRNRENLDKTTDEINKEDGKSPFWTVCDLNSKEDIETAWKIVEEKLGGIDILVNNCGGPPSGRFDEFDDEDWEEAFSQVLKSAVRFTRFALRGMKERKWGRIINITSLAVKQPNDNLILSNTFRSGLTAFAKTISNQEGEHNITINNVAPGYTLTSRLYELALAEEKRTGESHEHILAQMASAIPLKRLARPDEIAALVVFLASEPAGYITGTTIQVDGGFVKSLF